MLSDWTASLTEDGETLVWLCCSLTVLCEKASSELRTIRSEREEYRMTEECAVIDPIESEEVTVVYPTFSKLLEKVDRARKVLVGVLVA